jgi:hypothetical protein
MMRIQVYSLSVFRKRIRQAGAIVCMALMAQFLWAPLEARASSPQVQAQKQAAAAAGGQEVTRSFSIGTNGRESVEFTVPAAGRLQARAEWTGTASKLALILNGPGLTQAYTRQDGPSPLSLSFTITPALFAKGTAWKISVANFQSNSNAQGTIRVTLPAAPQSPQSSGSKTTGTAQTQTAQQAAGQTAQAQEKAGATAAAQKQQPARATGATQKAAQGLQTAQGGQVRTEAELRDIAISRARAEDVIVKATRSSPMAGILIPLFYHELERLSDNPSLLHRYYQLSQHKRGQTENDFARYFKRAVLAYKDIPADFKARHMNTAYVNLARGQSVDAKILGDDVIGTIKPSLRSDIGRAVKASFASKRLSIQPRPKTGRPAAQKTGAATASVQTQRIGGMLRAGSAGLSTAQKNELQSAVAAAGFQIREATAAHPAFQVLDAQGSLESSLPALNNKQSVVDYYRYMLTLDWFHCTAKNESSNDEPYFAAITVLPQFDPADPTFFHYLKEGCLNHVAGSVTRTYGGVKKGSDHGLTGNDRIVFDYLTFNAPVSFTIDLWEEDYGKGSVADGIYRAAMDIGQKILLDIKAAVMTQVISALKEAFMEQVGGAGMGSVAKECLGLLDQIIGGDLQFADFEQLLYQLFSGRAVDPSWYVLYFLFTGFDWAQTLAIIGGGSTVVGLVILGLAIFGPALSDMFSDFASGDIGGAFLNLLKIVTVIPLLIDFFKAVISGFKGFFEWLMSVLDPDDHLGTKTVVIKQTTGNWQNDAEAGEWTNAKLMGSVPLSQAQSLFNQHGYGPTNANSSFISNNSLFQVPGFTILNESVLPDWLVKGPYGSQIKAMYGDRLVGNVLKGQEYQIYYEVKRDVAGGRSTFGYYLPEPADQCKEITYKSKSSLGAWWKNIIRVSVMSVNTEDFPWVCLVNTATGATASNMEPGQTMFEVEAAPGATYKLSIWKFSRGEMGGFVSVYEGPRVSVFCPPPREVMSGGGPGGGNHHPPKKQL